MSSKASRHGSRWGAFRTLATAIRTATRPGSPAVGERLASVPRLLRATFRGDYTGTTRGRLLLLLGAVAYVVSPVDVLPEAFLPLLGLADDAMVVSWIAASLINETESFLRWERTSEQPVSRPAAGETVTGNVVS